MFVGDWVENGRLQGRDVAGRMTGRSPYGHQLIINAPMAAAHHFVRSPIGIEILDERFRCRW